MQPRAQDEVSFEQRVRLAEEREDGFVQPHFCLGRLAGIDEHRLQLELRKELAQLTAGSWTELHLDPLEIRPRKVVSDRLDKW